MAFLAPILSAAIPAIAGIFGNRSQTSNTGGTSSTQQSSTTLPYLTAQQQGVLYPLADKYLSMLWEDPNLTGYQAQQGMGIASNADILKRAATENYASRGITTGAAPAATATALDSNRIAQMNQLAQSIPLLKQSIFSNLIGLGTNLFSQIPGGTTTSGGQTTTQTGTVTQPGNILGGLFGNLDPTSIANAVKAIGGLFGGHA